MPRIVAIIVKDAGRARGGVPVFVAADGEEQTSLAFTLERILDATAHDLKNGTYVLVDHSSL